MAKLNFYDTDAVKAFVLDILIENAELKSNLDYEKKCSNDLVTIRIAGIGHKNVQRWMRYYKTMWMTWSH